MLLILAPKFSPGLTHISCEWYSGLVEVGPHHCEEGALRLPATPLHFIRLALQSLLRLSWSFSLCASTAYFLLQVLEIQGVQNIQQMCLCAESVCQKETVHSSRQRDPVVCHQ